MCCPAVPLALVLVGVVCAVAVVTPGWGPGGWRWWCLSASPAGVFGDADGDRTSGLVVVWCCRR